MGAYIVSDILGSPRVIIETWGTKLIASLRDDIINIKYWNE